MCQVCLRFVVCCLLSQVVLLEAKWSTVESMDGHLCCCHTLSPCPLCLPCCQARLQPARLEMDAAAQVFVVQSHKIEISFGSREPQSRRRRMAGKGSCAVHVLPQCAGRATPLQYPYLIFLHCNSAQVSVLGSCALQRGRIAQLLWCMCCAGGWVPVWHQRSKCSLDCTCG